MKNPVRILLPFPECKVPGGKTGVTLKTHHAALNDCSKAILQKRLEAIEAFHSAMNGGGRAHEVLGLSGRPFQEALAINRVFGDSPLMSVLDRNPKAFLHALRMPPPGAAVQRRVFRDVVFVCPLLGLLRADDLVPDYRCPAGAQLPRTGSLHHFWKTPVTAALNRLLKGAHVFSFLPARLSALWEPDGREAAVTVLRFSRRSGDRTVGETAAAPRLSGEALRYILENDARTANDLARFRSTDGHAYANVRGTDRGSTRTLNFVLDAALGAAAAG